MKRSQPNKPDTSSSWDGPHAKAGSFRRRVVASYTGQERVDGRTS
jgi:hypothetical protein